MLLANISVAQKIYDEFPDCAMLRKHPAPPPSNYDILHKASRSKVRGPRSCLCFLRFNHHFFFSSFCSLQLFYLIVTNLPYRMF